MPSHLFLWSPEQATGRMDYIARPVAAAKWEMKTGQRALVGVHSCAIVLLSLQTTEGLEGLLETNYRRRSRIIARRSRVHDIKVGQRIFMVKNGFDVL